MRETKFRAWHPGDDRFMPQFVKIFGLVPTDSGMNISFRGEVWPERNHPNISKKRQRQTRTNVPLGDVVLMQYTGLKDSEGEDIYEGDILEYESIHEVQPNGRYVVEYYVNPSTGSGWNWVFHHPNLNDTGMQMLPVKVIGNIYENGDLLNNGQMA